MIAVVGFVVFVVGLLVMEARSSDGAPGSGGVDPFVDLVPSASYRLEAGDAGSDASSYFAPTTINAPAGEWIEIVVENTGSISHNLRVSGPDGVYDTADDIESWPYAIRPGQEGRVVLMISEPGRYDFRCDFHQFTQTGTLVLR